MRLTWRGFLPLLLVLLGVWGMGHLLLGWQERETLTRDEGLAREDLVEIVSHLRRLVTPQHFFEDLARRIGRGFRWGGDLSGLVRSPACRGARFLVFSASGKRMSGRGFPGDLKGASERCFQLIQRLRRLPLSTLSPSESALAVSFLGGAENVSLIAGATGSLIDSSPLGVPRMQGLFPFRFRNGKRGWLLLDIDLLRIDRGELVRQGLSRISRLAGREYTFGTCDLGTPGETGDDRLDGSSRLVRQRMSQDPTTLEFQIGDRSVLGVPITNARRVFGIRTRPGARPGFEHGRMLLRLGLVAGFLLLLGIFRREETAPLPIRIKVIVLFGSAAGLSVLLLGGLAETYREVRREALFRQAAAEAGEVLRKADGGFVGYRMELGRFCQWLVRESGKGDDPGARFTQLIQPYRGMSRDWLTCVFMNGTGKIWYFQEPPGPSSLKAVWGAERVAMMTKMCRAAIRQHNANLRRPKGVAFEKLFDASLPTAVDLEKVLATQLLAAPGTVRHFGLGRASLEGSFELVCDASGMAVGGGMFFHEGPALARAFVQGLRSRQPQAGNPSGTARYRFFALPKGSRFRFTQAARSSGLAAHLLRFQDVLEQARTQTWRVVRTDRENLLITGVPGIRLAGVNLYCLMSTEPIERGSRSLLNRLVGLALLFLGFAVALGILFSETLLEPISELGRGLADLSAGRFRGSVVLSTGDEMQTLGDGINGILVEMQDLALARSIREALLPQEPLLNSRVRVAGWVESVGEGENGLYDYLSLADGGVALLAVRIPERGVSAGLRLGTLKMAVRSWLELGVGDPDRILGSLEREILKPSGGEHPGDMFLGLIDPSGTLRSATRGRPVVGECFGGPAGGSSGSRLVVMLSGRSIDDGARGIPTPQDLERLMAEATGQAPDVLGPAVLRLDRGGAEPTTPLGTTVVVIGEWDGGLA